MEKLEEFLNIGSGYGYGSGSGDGSGSGYGDGSGSGYGYGSGSDDGSGDGSGSGYGSGLKSLNSSNVYIIDDIQTIITSVRGNIAKGFILQSDLSLTPCFIAKENNLFAHGDTLHEAFLALQEKMYDNSSEEDRIEKFKAHFSDFSKSYPAVELSSWHHVLTGSCLSGRKAFARDNDIDVKTASYTIYEFIELTKNSYKGNVIIKLLKNS